jgi:hypothetical protein
MGIVLFDMTASIRHEVTAPDSSNSISVTMKCFSLLVGMTAVHLLLSNFLGFMLFIIYKPVGDLLMPFCLMALRRPKNLQQRFYANAMHYY